MISNLYIFILYYLSIPLSFIGYGLFFFSLNKDLKISSNYGYAGLTGVIILSIYSYFSSLFISHSELHNFFDSAYGFFFFVFLNLKTMIKIKFYLFF